MVKTGYMNQKDELSVLAENMNYIAFKKMQEWMNSWNYSNWCRILSIPSSSNLRPRTLRQSNMASWKSDKIAGQKSNNQLWKMGCPKKQEEAGSTILGHVSHVFWNHCDTIQYTT